MRNSGCNPHSSRGLTLVELMVVIVLVAILATLAGPSFSELIERRRLANQTEAVTDLIQLARSEAIKHSNTTLPREVAVTINPGTTWSVGVRNGNAACTDAATCVVNEAGTDIVRFVSNTSATTGADIACAACTMVTPDEQEVIVFSFRGMVEAGGGDRTIEIRSPRGYQTRVTVSRIGRVSVCTTTSPVGSYPSC